MQHIQVSALCSTQFFFSYLPKSIAQFFFQLPYLPKVSHNFLELWIDMPHLCTNMDTNMETGNQQEQLDFTSAIKMFSFCL